MRALTLLACLSLFCPRADAAKKTPPGAKLTHIVGVVSFESGDSKGAAIEGQPLKSDDWVETDKGATAVVALPDGSALKLRESSRFQLELPQPKTSVTSVLLSWGGVFAKVAKVLPGARFDVHTETA